MKYEYKRISLKTEKDFKKAEDLVEKVGKLSVSDLQQ